MKLGYAVTFHHSEHIRPNGKKVLNDNLSSFYESCKYDFDCFLVDNQSVPKNSIEDVVDFNNTKWKNLHHTYVENQLEKGITGAWSLSVKNAIDAGCDIVILTTDDTVCDTSINKLIEFIENDVEYNYNTLYAPAANGWGVPPIQARKEPVDSFWELKDLNASTRNYLSGNMYAFTKEFYHKYKNSDGDLFYPDHKHNGGDGKWGGQEGQVIGWSEQGARVVVVGGAVLQVPGVPGKTEGTRLSYRTIRYIDHGDIDKVIAHYTSIGDYERVEALKQEKLRLNK